MADRRLATRRLNGGGGEGTLLFLHATGLNASTYVPLLQDVGFDGEVLAPSLRGHGATVLPADPKTLRDWRGLAQDVVADHIACGGGKPLIMAGHSAGAVTALLAAKELRPRKLLLIEPVILPRLYVNLAATPLRRWTTDRIPIAQAAARRRDVFPSRQEAEENYRQKPFFAGWDERALTAYLDEGLEVDDTGEVRLACTPAFEAAMFRAQSHGFWPHVKYVLKQGTEVSVLAAAERTVTPPFAQKRLRRLGAEVTVMQGGHMLPLERPAEVATWLRDRTGV
ncbi:MAG: alpha/beta hydrolase [Parvularcula sp.]|jgi:pimeloyl-ACP methyl ester carboxylesterase|nr:alpha/beta hydrolase [Parvularcula sp.]